ncbi:MAG: diguanylate cyclase [Dehalococcoidia bacterium]|nr:diguanylate cyclase [Dehalococcoidia bacterium]
MNIYAIPPLLAAIAYIPLLAILLANRPWNRQQRLFAWFLIAAVLWSGSDILLRGDFFMQDKFLLAKVVACTFTLAAAQFHCFVSSYYPPNKSRWLPLAYTSLAIVLFLVAIDYMPEDIIFVDGKLYPEYGNGVFLMGLPLVILTVRSVHILWQQFRTSDDPVLRNQMVYLLLSIGILVAAVFTVFIPWGNEVPISHIGNLINAVILNYAVLRHRLLDIKVVFRRGLVWVGLIAVSIGLYLALFLLIHSFTGIELDIITLALATLAAIAIGGGVYLLQSFFSRGADRLYYRARYDYIQRLRIFLRNELSGVLSLRELIKELLPLLTGALDCRQVYLLLPDSGGGDLVVQFSEPKRDDTPQVRLMWDNQVLGWLRRENRYLLKESLDINPEFSGMRGEEKDWLKDLDVELLFPVVSRGSLIGVLALGEKESGKYSLEDVNLVETVIAKVAVSVEKEYLQEGLRKREQEYLQGELRKREQELDLINRLAIVITSSLNIREVYDAFITGLREVVSIDWATIALIEGDEISLEVLSTEVGSAWGAGDKMPLKGTGTEWVAKQKRVLFEPDLKKKKMFWTSEGHLRQGIRSIIYLPLLVRGQAIGSLIIASRKPNAYTPGQIHLLERLASQIAMPVENSRLYARAEQRARIDELTNLFNRRHFDECIKQEIERHSRYEDTFYLIFLDLDFFKAYNDTQGHTAGDKILELIGKLINKAIRNTDLAFRYGGDEFAIILPQSATNDALVVAERVRGRIASEMSKRDIRISASLGLASWPSDGVATDEFINAADRALYYAKETGGNRSCIASKMLPSPTGKATTRAKSKDKF